MTKPLSGVRVLELASHIFVPIGGGILTEQGAEVIKVEPPNGGDPFRGLVTAGLLPTFDGVQPNFQFTNRGKQSIVIDLKKKEGRDLIYRMAAKCDVFLTNYRPNALQKLKIEVEDIRAHNPSIIYVRGTGYGVRGQEVNRGGYDAAVYWSRSGMSSIFMSPDAEAPISPRPAFGDVVGGLAIAGAIAAALYQRAITGKAPIVDVSLLAAGMWQLQPDITDAKINPAGTMVYNRKSTWNPLTNTYRTSDKRFIMLMMLDADRYWSDFCEVVGHPELIADARFVDMPARKTNSSVCVEILDSIFASRSYREWCDIFEKLQGVWAPVQTPLEIHSDQQAIANGYLADVEMGNGSSLTIVTSPAQFDEEVAKPTRAPELGEHTEAVLLDFGLSWDDITTLKDKAVIG